MQRVNFKFPNDKRAWLGGDLGPEGHKTGLRDGAGGAPDPIVKLFRFL